MKLNEYLATTKQTYRGFGALVGKSGSDICRFAKGVRSPSLETAIRIEQVTGGQVRPSDLVKEGVAA